ncbi:glycerophosphodiester phosphodiesterase family protein [Falsirhodobacter algicola]|uniref:Glycerophosphodiester phosphodiesterase n=1 Tax=Falsirhodobacter algicola TaxID=2692330 RepID=A0A8J8MTS8_9RHOB|nr:glycerophosphodiester phosphodiesterase family protein [Falsirhodobacter algicola]QUS36339.1 glycerophosphodiester phosphodiesterase [Falsirhodobacter algicola]
MHSYRTLLAAHPAGAAVIAHRGAWHRAPENSLASIRDAIALGCTAASVDVRGTRDGHLILLRDDTALRMTGAALRPAWSTLAEMRARPLFRADGATRRTTAERVPTLTEALDLARGRIALELDLRDPSLLPNAVACVQAAGAEGFAALRMQVGSTADVRRLARLQQDSGIAVVAVARAGQGGLPEALLHHPPFMVDLEFQRLEDLRPAARTLRRAGIAVRVGTVEGSRPAGLTDRDARWAGDAVWGQLLAAGVGAIQTDEPARLRGWLRAVGVAA